MAERNSTRTGSRRNTPQSVAEPTRTTRATRSQSREVSDVELPRYSERVQRKPKKTASRSAEQGASQTATRGHTKETPERPGLSTVNEDPSIVIEDRTVGVQDMEADQEQLPILDAKSSGRVSGISGTTARTSNSAQELVELTSEDLNVLDALPDLSESSKKFLSGLMPIEMSSNAISRMRSGLQDKRSGLNRSRKRFTVDLESCLPDQPSSIFIDIPRALPILYETGDDQGDNRGRIELVFHAANLAILASNILLYPHQEDALFLETLDARFPSAFTNDGSDQDLAIDTRIQYAIERLGEYLDRPDFDHDVVLNQVFYSEDGKTLRGYNLPAKQNREYRDALTTTHEVIKRIRDIWTEESQSSPVERLRDVYDWDEYVADMMVWISDGYVEVKAALDMVKVERIVLGLKKALKETKRPKQSSGGNGDNGAEAEAGQVDLSSYSPPSKPSDGTGQLDEPPEPSSTRARELTRPGYLNLGSPRLAHGAKSMKRAMARHLKASNSAQQTSHHQFRPAEAESEVASTAVPAAQDSTPRIVRVQQVPSSAPAKIQKGRGLVGGDNDDDWTPHADDNDGEFEDHEEDEEDAFQTHQIQQENAERALQLKESREAESNKENQAGLSQPKARKHLIDRQVDAVRVPWGSQDLGQDEGFQQSHNRPSSDRQILQPINKRNAPEPLANMGRSPAKRARFQETPIGDGDDIQDSQQAPRASQVYNLANTAAKQMTALQPKEPQARKPWTEDETERLLELIEKFGTSWKQLKEEDRDLRILDNRDQVALKDKARNMKFDFLKAGKMLPKYFDKITLSKLLIDKLGGLGIVYDTVAGTREDAEE